MDVKGAKALTERLAERQWREAESVRLGEQPSEDPDAAYLDTIDDDVRFYAFPASDSGDSPRRVKKVLVDGFWRLESAADGDAHAAA
jgi:hypothetical protein